MLAALRNCGGKRVFSECKQNKLQTGQNSHLAVEPAAPAVLCRKKCADYFEYGVKFFYFFFFCTRRDIFCIIQVFLSTIPLVQSTRRGFGASMESSTLPRCL